MAEYITHSREETVALGRKLAAVLPDGALIAFTGGLGAGKTAFVRVWPRGWAAPTRSAAPPLPSSTITAAPVRWPTSTSTVSPPRTTCVPPVSTIIWIRGAIVAAEWSENFADLLALENPIHINIDRVDDTTRRITIEGAAYEYLSRRHRR